MNDGLTGIVLSKAGIVAAGFFGSIISLAFAKSQTPKRGVVAVLGGTILAGFLGHEAALLVGFSESVVGFVIGLLGMSLLGLLFSLIDHIKQNPSHIINLIRGNKND